MMTDGGGGGARTSADGLIDPTLFPARSADFSEDAVLGSASAVSGIGDGVLTNAETVQTEWGGLQAAGVYEAPEQGEVYDLMRPAVERATEFRDAMSAASSAISAYASELAGIQADLADLEERAAAFRVEALAGYEVKNYEANGWLSYIGWSEMAPTAQAEALGTDLDPMGTTTIPWKEHGPAVEKNEELLEEYAQILERVSAAAVTCATAINAQLSSCPTETPVAITAEDIMATEDIPWGFAATEDRNCSESVGHGLGEFWHGTWTGAASLIGRDPESGEWSWGNAGNAWWGVGDFALSTATVLNPTNWAVYGVQKLTGQDEGSGWFEDRLNVAAGSWGSLIGYDHQATLAGENGWHKWEEDGVAAGTESLANIGSFFIPVGGWAAGAAKTTAAGARVASLMSRVSVRAGEHALSLGSRLTEGGVRIWEHVGGGWTRTRDLLGDLNTHFDRTVPDGGIPSRPVPETPVAPHSPVSESRGLETPETAAPRVEAEGPEAAPRPDRYQPSDVEDAWENATRNDDGVRVDPRTGAPLREFGADGSRRGWVMSWDSESGTWTARNPGDGWGDTPRPGGMSFDESRGADYSSGDAYHPGDHPPHSPDTTLRDADGSGWQERNRGPSKPWMDYQEQVSGITRNPDGSIPEFGKVDPETGNVVSFDGHTYRGNPPVETFLEAKDGYAGLRFDPDSDRSLGIRQNLLNEVRRQLDVLPDDARLEWHVSTEHGAAAIRDLLRQNRISDVTVLYTPRG